MPSPDHMQLDNQLCRSLYSASNAMVRAYRPLLEPLGLTYPQYLVMLALWEHDRVSVGDVCQRTRLDTGTVTPLLKRLEGKGLLQRERSLQDERKRVIRLTAAGNRLRRQAEHVPIEMACLNLLSPAEAEQLWRLAEKLYGALTEPEP